MAHPLPTATGKTTSSTRTTPFGPLTIAFDDTLLEPREWTTQQSRWAADLLRDLPAGPVLELCAGAGQIGLLALHLSGRSGVLVDVNPTAGHFSRANAEAAGLAAQADVRTGDVAEVLSDDELFPFALIDPPWVPADRISTYPEDPVLAIDGGPDGLDVARHCLTVAAAHLAPDGLALIQLGTTEQVDSLEAWLARPDSLPLVSETLRVAEVRSHQDRGVLVLLARTSTRPHRPND